MRLLRLAGVFEPHSDSWLLASHMLREPLREQASVLDLCAGSGILAVLAASRAQSRVTAVDVSRRALLTTRLNAALNGVSVRTLRGYLFEPVRRLRFDLIVSNPPYVPGPNGRLSRHGAARAWEAGPSGREFIDPICEGATGRLNAGGVLLLVQSSVCGEQRTVSSLAEHGLLTEVVARHRGPLGPRLSARAGWLRERGLLDADGLEEMLVIRAQRPSA